MEKAIENIYHGAGPHMVGDGFKVINYFPSGNKIDVSPFILLDYMIPTQIAPTAVQKGVGAHPHRGFETVTFLYEGAIAHRDSHGGGGVIRAGDVQWMTAGSGVLHEEFHEKEFSKRGGTLHGIQLWINLPSKLKMTEPCYQTLSSQSIPRKILNEQGSYVRVIAGNFENLQGVAKTHTPMEVYDVSLNKETSVRFTFPEQYNTFILVVQGLVTVNSGQKAAAKDLIAFSHSGKEIDIQASQDAKFLVLSGLPLNEPVIQSGPFVMNSEAEIDQAYRDFRSGKFGQL